MTNQTIIDAACALCDARLLSGEDTNDPGSHGILCGDCWAIVHGTCAGCGTPGTMYMGNMASFRWRLANYARSQFVLMANAMHPECVGDYHWIGWRDRMADAYVRRFTEFAPARTPDFWSVTETMDDLAACEDSEDWRCDACSYACDGCYGTFASLERSNGMHLCVACAMPQCDECGDRYEDESEARRCCSGMLHDYSYRPTFRFWKMGTSGTPIFDFPNMDRFGAMLAPTDDLYLGIELETECGYETFDRFISDAGESHDNPEFLYGKSDGSLDSSGVEIVTMPATMDAFMARFPFDALQAWNNRGARSFYRGSCGFHVHVSRAFFTPTHMWRFVAWQMRNQSFCEMLAQRNSSQWARWQTLGDFGTDYKPPLGDIVKGKASNGERYVAINFQNDATIELRYFRGNLRPEAIRTRLEFVDALARFTKNLSARDVINGALTIPEFVEWTMTKSARYPNLAMWISENDLGRNA